MYPNFNAERARYGITLERLSKESGFSLSKVSAKLSGKSPITLTEAKIFKKIVKSNLPIETLFSKEALES